ncbi:putative aarF domain-containing protein kinase, chloroplastic [Symbiodinium microadriaticum]|uniref:Putative aarF domain-containing protein kinase, chloroplastic n=1 Tax=Symbiodinium microadriaticum TaxID=2951 RepID=A0A1Q9DUI5_SYMMI|nr:putative aarF domain-containing protein kinase, chloroplastic [Symbiodinium microadriaticum]
MLWRPRVKMCGDGGGGRGGAGSGGDDDDDDGGGDDDEEEDEDEAEDHEGDYDDGYDDADADADADDDDADDEGEEEVEEEEQVEEEEEEEEALLYMIGLSAQTLKAKEALRRAAKLVQPYADHPAHKDYSTILADGSTALDPAFRSCLERLYKSDPELGPTLKTFCCRVSIHGLTSVGPGHPFVSEFCLSAYFPVGAKPKAGESRAEASPKAGDKRSDLEDVLASFTPRLRAIREEQECEPGTASAFLEAVSARPSIRPEICIDLYILRLMAGVAQRWFRLNTDLPSLVDEYGSRLVDELDFRREAERAIEFRQHVHDLELNSVTAAKPVTELTTASVLVTEWVTGERLETVAAGDLEEAKRLQGVAMTTYLAMLLEMGSLHADPHWGNWLRREVWCNAEATRKTAAVANDWMFPEPWYSNQSVRGVSHATMQTNSFRLCEPVAIPPVQVPEPVEEDFQQKEIFSLLKEATDLRRQQQRLEMQISQAQEGDAPWPEDRLEKGEADVSTAAPLEGSEVLITSQLALAREAHDAALRLREAEAAVSTLQADAEALEKQSRLVEEEVQEMAGPLKELEALREESSGRAKRLEALKSREEALSELCTKRLALQEAAGKLQAELQETSAKELPQVAKRRREADLEDRGKVTMVSPWLVP